MDAHETFPIVPLRDVVVFPNMMMPFIIGRPSTTRALEDALLRDKRIFVAAQHDAKVDDPQPADVYTMGCVANILQSLKLPDGNIKVLIEGVERARAVEWQEQKDSYRVVVEILPKQKEPGVDAEATMSRVMTLFKQYVELSNNAHYHAMNDAARVHDPGKLADTIAAHLLIGVDEKQNLLEMLSPVERLNRIAGILEAEVAKLQVDYRIQSHVKKQMEKAQKKYYVRARQRAIRNEIDDLKSKIEASDTPPDVRANAAKDLERLETLSKIPDDVTSMAEHFDWPGVPPLQGATRDRPSLETIQAMLRPERGKEESADLSERHSAPVPSPTTGAPLWVAAVSGFIGGSVFGIMQWLVGWFSR